MQTTTETEPLSPDIWAGHSVRLLAVPIELVRLAARREQWWSRLSHHGILPVIGPKKRLAGVLRQDLLMMGTSIPPASLRNAEQLMSSAPAILQTGQTIEDAIQLFERYNLPLIPIVDAKGRYTGECASYTQLYRLNHGLLRPARVGGFATPFGVYLTSGSLSGGVSWTQLMATAVLFGLLIHLLDWSTLLGFSALAALCPGLNLLQDWQVNLTQGGILIITLLALLRFSPVSGFHAAEHMTVSAIEQELPLTAESVCLQPREHIRCGTNLMVLLGSFQLLIFCLSSLYRHVNWLGLALYVLIWIGVTLLTWRPIGLWLQRRFTTKPPTDAQLENGIEAGSQLLSRFSQNPHPRPTFWQRLWGSRLLPLLGASLLSTWLFGEVIRHLLGLSSI